MNSYDGRNRKDRYEDSWWEVLGDFLGALLEALGDILSSIDISDIDFGGD